MEPRPLAPLAPVLSTQEVAELLRLSTRSVLEMVKAGTLAAHRAPGRRRYHFLTEEVLAAVSGRPPLQAPEDDSAHPGPPMISAPSATTVDPCDVWGAAPTRGVDWPVRCVERWVELAAAADLIATAQLVGEAVQSPAVGIVAVDGLEYRVLAGPRQRVRCLSDDGEPGWALIDSVWVEPALPAALSCACTVPLPEGSMKGSM